MMVAWVVDQPARERLAAFTSAAWPGLPNLLDSHHLQGLLRLDAAACPAPVGPSSSTSLLNLPLCLSASWGNHPSSTCVSLRGGAGFHTPTTCGNGTR